MTDSLIEELKELYLNGDKKLSSLAGRTLNYIADLRQPEPVAVSLERCAEALLSTVDFMPTWYEAGEEMREKYTNRAKAVLDAAKAQGARFDYAD